MLINFIGSPASGKTTVAASVFAKLKEDGIPCEFVAEQARYYIARKKQLAKKHDVLLDNYDQYAIMDLQETHEEAFKFTVGDSGIVIADSSVINGLLYINPIVQTEDAPAYHEKIAENAKKRVDMFFYCHTIPYPNIQDHNRMHSKEQSLAIDKLIPLTLERYGIKAIELFGNQWQRYNEVLRIVHNEFGNK